jgi:acetylornithine deacetylase
MDLINFTRTLINIPSVSGEEKEVGEFLTDYLDALGYNVEKQEVEANCFNLIATTAEKPTVVFSTHIDTVPPFIQASEDDEFLYGRGSCDAKGIIAAQIFAAEKLRAEGIENIGLLFTADEEVASIGAKKANEHRVAKECRYLINGEPTDNILAIGSKGSLRIRLRAKGIAAHSAYPENGESAIEKLLDVLNDVRKFDFPVSDFFGETTCNIGVINGGTRTNVIPDFAHADLHFRLVTPSEETKSAIEKLCDGKVEVEYLSKSEPVKMLAVDGFQQTVVRFTTDIPYLTNWGQPLLLGAGSILDAHTEHEKVSKKELEKSVELYVKLAKTLLRNLE